jgi:hypothetical protein
MILRRKESFIKRLLMKLAGVINFHFNFSTSDCIPMSTSHIGYTKPKLMHSKFSFILFTIK